MNQYIMPMQQRPQDQDLGGLSPVFQNIAAAASQSKYGNATRIKG
jgi:hypothetical protein